MTLSMPVALIAILNIIFVTLLPRIFFRQDGTWNLKWLLTAAPYAVNPIFLLLNTEEIAIWEPVVFGFTKERLILETAGIPFFALSIALIGFTIGIHRVPIALWHQENDVPKSIVTQGPYAWVRHPFYTSFFMCLIGCVIVCPHPAPLGTLIYATVALMVTARREEQRLSASEFGDEYREYMTKVGRFFPGIGRVS